MILNMAKIICFHSVVICLKITQFLKTALISATCIYPDGHGPYLSKAYFIVLLQLKLKTISSWSLKCLFSFLAKVISLAALNYWNS